MSSEPGGEKPSCDAARAVEFLRMWSPGGRWVLTTISPELRGGGTITETFTAATADECSAWVHKHNVELRRNCYFTVNIVARDLDSKAAKTDIAAVAAACVDTDPRPGFPFDEERARLRRLHLEERPAGVPPPTLIIDSGGGYQSFWKLRTPITVGGDAARAESAEALSRRLEELYEGDHCHSCDHVFRLPWTINYPNSRKKARGQTEERQASVVVHDQSMTYQPSDLPQPAAPERERTRRVGERGERRAVRDLSELDRWGVSERVKEIIRSGRAGGEGPKRGDDSRSAWLFDAVCSMVRGGVPDEMVVGIITDRRYAISACVLEKGRKAEAHAWHNVESAHAMAEQFATGERKDGSEYVLVNLRNITIALARLGVELSHNEFNGKVYVKGLDGFGPELSDAGLTRLWFETQERFHLKPSFDYFEKAVMDTAYRNSFHPLMEYLDNVAWDGTPRLDTWLTEYGGADDTPFNRAVGAIVLIAAVRRVRRPGVKFDELLVIESEQGMNKSTALARLAVRQEWFSDSLPLSSGGREVIEQIEGRWIIEIGELQGMRKAEIEHIKAFLSRQEDRGRAAYARMPRVLPRQCVMVGTTNAEDYLKDETGNRRFWPVKIRLFDVDRLERDRDQLWAEAAAREAKGESIRLPPSLYKAAEEQQEERRSSNPFTQILGDKLNGYDGVIRSLDVWTILGVPAAQRRGSMSEMGSAMRELGWQLGRLKINGHRVKEYCYTKGQDGRQIIVTETFNMGQRLVGVRHEQHDEPGASEPEPPGPPPGYADIPDDF